MSCLVPAFAPNLEHKPCDLRLQAQEMQQAAQFLHSLPPPITHVHPVNPFPFCTALWGGRGVGPLASLAVPD